MKDALNEDNALIEAGPDASEVATCLGMPFIPACGGTVVLRSRRYGRGSKKNRFALVRKAAQQRKVGMVHEYVTPQTNYL
jgi:hypothetical protein